MNVRRIEKGASRSAPKDSHIQFLYRKQVDLYMTIVKRLKDQCFFFLHPGGIGKLTVVISLANVGLARFRALK